MIKHKQTKFKGILLRQEGTGWLRRRTKGGVELHQERPYCRVRRMSSLQTDQDVSQDFHHRARCQGSEVNNALMVGLWNEELSYNLYDDIHEACSCIDVG